MWEWQAGPRQICQWHVQWYFLTSWFLWWYQQTVKKREKNFHITTVVEIHTFLMLYNALTLNLYYPQSVFFYCFTLTPFVRLCVWYIAHHQSCMMMYRSLPRSQTKMYLALTCWPRYILLATCDLWFVSYRKLASLACVPHSDGSISPSGMYNWNLHCTLSIVLYMLTDEEARDWWWLAHAAYNWSEG